jgi:hypothetical protein
MMRHTPTSSTALRLPLVLFIMMLPATTFAYSQYTVSDDGTYCATCHGDFRASNYISTVDGQSWGNLHNLHRSTMLSGDCEACHGSGDTFPVELSVSAGGSGLDPLSCMGCHGRAEDNTPQNPSYPDGYGAGLRQHHTNAGIDDCLSCHDDANPANYTPVAESILPPYYANPGTGHTAMPTSACNDDGSENFAGLAIGLDNDGNDLYDEADASCNLSNIGDQPVPIARLLQNHPNPFNPSTTIEYAVEKPGDILLQVFSLNGNHVRTLVNRHHGEAMTYQVTWNGRDDGGNLQASGVFFYRLEAAGASEMKKMILIK